MKSNSFFFKFAFGAIIFIFSVSLAYFTAYYIQDQQPGHAAAEVAFWITLLGFAGVYAVIGILVSSIFPISLGFLFGAAELLIHVGIRNYENIPPLYRVSLVAIVVIILEVLAWLKLADSVAPVAAPIANSPSSPVLPGVPPTQQPPF